MIYIFFSEISKGKNPSKLCWLIRPCGRQLLISWPRLSSCENIFSHWTHWYGFSPVSCPYMNMKITPYWSHPSISSNMIDMSTTYWKCFLTVGAMVWFLFSMCPHVNINIILYWNWFLAIAALLWFSTTCVLI